MGLSRMNGGIDRLGSGGWFGVVMYSRGGVGVVRLPVSDCVALTEGATTAEA